ncbi:MAG: GNAT family N-acetyltransferase [Clostridia bacterium]|nr:GNAT family N-acetyltransferase [Clostridia bacterium]
MEVRYITSAEAADYQKVSAASFIWKFNAEEDSYVDFPVLAAFDNGKLVAGVELFDFRSNYCGKFLEAIVISGVCSLPEYRRTGCVRKIFEEVGKIAVENDWTFGFLHPFSISCYEKFGFANLNRMFSIKVPFEQLKNIPRSTDVELYNGEQFAELSELHAKCALKENLMTLREDKKHFCDTPFEEADYTYIHRDKNGTADGYVRFKVNRPNDLVVDDLYVLTPDALNGIVGFLRGYDGIVKTLIVNTQYPGSPFACLTDRLDGVVYETKGGVAGRIYNMQKLLESNIYPEKSGRFRIKSLDEFEQNQGIFEVEYKDGKATVSRKADGDYDIALTAPAAVRLLLAGEGHTAESAVYIDGVEINGNADDFFRAFPFRQTRFTDSKWSE